MSTHFPDSPEDCPPPAYEFSQAEFDQKLADATAQSLLISDHYTVNPTRARGPDGHPPISSTSPSASSVRTVDPLNFQRKAFGEPGPSLVDSKDRSSSTSVKEKPSWLSEAQLDSLGSSSSLSPRSRRLPTAPIQRSQASSFDDAHLHSDRATFDISSEEARGDVPPPFASPDPLENAGYQQLNGTARPLVVLRYSGTGDDLAASPPPSPPQSPVFLPHEFGTRPRTATPRVGIVDQAGFKPFAGSYQTAQEHMARRQTAQQKSQHALPPRSQMSSYNPPPPRLVFDPSIAYNGMPKSTYGQPSADPLAHASNATALYSSAVSQILDSQASNRQTKQSAPGITKSKRYTSSIYSNLTESDANDPEPDTQVDIQRNMQARMSASRGQQQLSSYWDSSTMDGLESPADTSRASLHAQYPRYAQHAPHATPASQRYYTQMPSQSGGMHYPQAQFRSASQAPHSLYPR